MKRKVLVCLLLAVVAAPGCVVKTRHPHHHPHPHRHHRHLDAADLGAPGAMAPLTDSGTR